MSYSKVTDQSILDELNGKKTKKVTDPSILKQLNSGKTDSKNMTGDIFRKGARETGKSLLSNLMGNAFKKIPFSGGALEEPSAKAGYGAVPALEQVPQGIKEGGLSALSALIGKDYQNEPIPDEYGAGFGRGLGQMVGQGAIAAAPGGLAAKGLTRLGLPKAIAALLGTGVGFGATTQGDILDRGLAGLEAAGLHGAGKLVGGLVKGTIPIKETGKKVKSAFNFAKHGRERNLAREGLNEKALQDSDALQDLLTHKDRHAELIEEQEPIESKMKQNPLFGGTVEEDTFKRKSNTAQKEKAGIGQDLAQEPEMNPSMMPQKPIVEPENLKETIKNQESLLKESKQKAAEHEEAMKSHLGEGEEHGVPIAEHVVNKVKEVKKDIGNEYKGIEQDLVDKNVTIPRTDSIEKIENEFRELLKSSKVHFRTDEEFENTVKQMAKSQPKRQGVDIIPANEFLNNFRSARKIGQKMQSDVYEKGITKDEQAIRQQKADEMIKISDDMEHILEQQENLGESLEKLKSANKRWRTEITPLYENSVYKNFLNKGYSSSEDLIYALRGNKEGQVIIKDIIKKSPEMTKRIVGMSHAKNPSDLLRPRELTREYLNLPHMEDTRKLVDQFKGHLQDIGENEQQLNKLKQTHETNEGKRSENKVEQQRRDKVSSLYDNMVKLDADVAQLENAAETARHMANQKKISLKEKVRLEKEAAKATKEHRNAEKLYREAEARYKKSVKDALSISGVVGSAFLGGASLNKAKKMIID